MSNDKPLTREEQVRQTAIALQAKYGFDTPSGRTKALYEGSKHDDILFSKKYKDTLIQSKRDGLISTKDAQRIGSYMAERAVELANNGKASGFTPGGEYKPWVSKADMRKERQAAKDQYAEDIDQVAAADRAQIAASGYRPEDLQNQGYKLPEGTPWASGYEMPITGSGFAKDPMHELGIYGQQVAQGIVGGGQGLSQVPQALGARMMGQDPSAVVQEGTPNFEAGQVTGQRFANSVAQLPITVPAMSGGGAAGSAIGGGIGSLFGPGGRIAGQVIGGFLGGAAGAYGGHHLANWAGTGAMNMLLGQAANAKLQEKQEGMANKYPLAARYGESALEVSMFAPRIKPEGFSTRLAAQGYKQSGMRGLRKGITDQGAFLNSFVEGGGEGALALWQAKQQSDREKELGMPGKSAMDILAEGAFGALFQKETKFGKKVFGKLSGREFMENRAKAQPQFNPTSVEGLAGKSATRPSTGVDTATMTPEGWRRINLGGRIKGGLDAEGNPIVSGARYAVYNPTDRKAHIYTDNDFALTGERTRNAAFNLTVADKLFKHNPIMGYKDPVDGVQRMVLGITRDAGVRVRDIKDDLTSNIKVVPLSEIRDKKIAKRIDEVMQEQGVLANKAPAPHTPEAFANADKIAFPDEVTIDETGPVAGRVVSQIGRKDSNMFVVALPDGSHIRLNGGSINVGKPGSVLVRGKLSESHFPTSLADLVAPKGGLENQAFIKDGEEFHHLQLTPDQKSLYAQVKNKFAADIRAAKDEPDDARRDAMIGIVKNKMGEEFARVATIAPPSGKFKDADVIDVTLEQSKFKGVPQTAIVVGRNKFGYQVRLVDHTNIGEFTVPEALVAGYDPSMGMPDAETNFEGPTADGSMPKSAMPGPGTVPIGQPLGPGAKPKVNTSTVREGTNLTVEENPNADNVDFHELPEPIRARIEGTLAKHGEHIKRLGIGNSITINENSANAIHDITIKRLDPTSWQYTMRTSDVDPKTRAVTKQYVSDYTLSVDDKTGNIIATIGNPVETEQPDDAYDTSGEQTVMAYQTDSEAEAGQPSTPQFEPGSTTRGRAAMSRRYILGRVNYADAFEYKRQRTLIEQDPTLSQTEKEKKIIALEKRFKETLDEIIKQGLFNLNRITTQARLPDGMQATGSREERYGYKIKSKEGNDLTQLQYAETEPASINDKEVVQTAVKMGKDTFLLNAIRVSNKKQLATVLSEQYKVNSQVAGYISDVVDRFARGWALDKVNAQIGRAHDLFESTGKLQEHLANRKPGEYADTRGMYFRQFARTEPEVNKAVSEFMREFYRERFAAFAVLDQATAYDDKYRGAIFKAVKDNNTAFNVIVGFSSRNVSTAVHEIAHALLRGMSDENKALVVERFHHAARAKDNRLPLDVEEAWAGAFEAALMRGQFPQNYAAQKMFSQGTEKNRLLYDPVLQKTWEEVGHYLSGVRDLIVKKRDQQGLPTNAQFRAGQVFWEAPYKSDERVFNKMSLEVMMPGGHTEFGVVTKAQTEIGAPISIRMNSGEVLNIDPSQVTRIAGWTDGFNNAVLDLVANMTRQNYTQHMRELEASNPEFFRSFSSAKPTITGSYDTVIGTSPRKITFQTNVDNQLNEAGWFADQKDVSTIKKYVSGLVNSGRVILDTDGKVDKVLDQRGKPSFAYSVLQSVNGYTPETALAMYAITETPEFRKWSGGKPLVEAVYNTDVRAGMPVSQLMSDERVMIRQMMAGIDFLKALKAAYRGDRSDDLIGDIEVLSKDYYGYNTPDSKKAADMAEFYTSDTDESNAALAGLISSLDYEINKSTKFDMVRHLTQSSIDYRSAMRKPRTGTGFVTMAFHPNDSHAWLPREGGYIIPNGVGKVDGVGRGGAYIRMNNPLVVDLKNNGMATDRVAKYKEQAKAAGRDSVVLLNVRHSIGGASTLHNMVISMNNHPMRVMDSMGKINLSTFFSGGGLIEVGSKDVATPIKAVEFDKGVASVYRSNHGDHVEVGDVRNVDIASMAGTEWFHASPVCKNYSVASTAKTESNEDITTAKAVVDVVDRIQPPVVTIENVKQYEGTEAFNMIIEALNRNGYNHQTAVYKTSDFAGSTMRERLLIRATRGFALPPITQNKLYKAKSWYEAVEDLIDDMPIGQLTQQQAKQFSDRGMDLATIDQPYLVQSTSKGAPQKMYGPAYTVMAGTGQAMRIVLPGGIVKVVTDRALARWQGLPDSYVLPNAHTLANKVVGNGVPTELTKYVLAPVAEAYMKHKAKQTAQTAMGETMMAFQSVDDIELARSTQGKVEYAQFDPAMYGDAISKTGKRLSDNADFIQKSAALADVRPGQMIATRLNINFLQNFRVPIQSVHATTASATRPYDGKVIAYSHAITVNNPSFVVDQKAVHDISSGVKTKFPMAAVMGEYVKTATDKHLVSGEELRFNPKDTNLFVDSQGRPVKSVRGTVTAYGTKVYVHPGGQIEYWGSDAPQRYVAPQTEMAFQSTGEDEIGFESPYDPSMAMGNRVYTQPASPGAPSTVTRIMPRSSPSGYGRWWAAVDFLNDITRMVLSGDLAFTTLQAGIIGLSNPKVGITAFMAGLKGFAPNMQIEVNGQKIGTRKLGREVYHKVGDQMRANPVYEIAREAGLKMQMFEIDERFNDMRQVELANLRNEDPTATIDDCKTTLMDVDELGTNDEWYMKNRLTAHLPGQGQFERYNSILHDTILLTQFDNWYKTLLSQGYEPGSEKFNKAMKDTARILNVSVGDIQYSTDTTKDAAASRIAKVLFTAPRWLMSRALIDPMINTGLSNISWVRDVMGHDNPVFDLYKNGTVDPEVRKLGISMWLRVAGAQIAMMIMAIIYQNWNPDVEANADKSFGRIRVGDVRFDPPAGIFDHYRLGIRLYQALLSTDPKNVQKAEKAGVPLWYYQVEDLRKEMQYKSSPLVNTVVSMFGGNDPAAFFSGVEGIQNAQAKSVVGEPYYGSNEPATFFYDSFIRPRVAQLFGNEVADNGGFSNGFIERLPTVFPQFMDAYYRAYEYDRPPLAYALANMIPNFLGFKVEVTPAEYLKDRVKNRNEVTDSPNILKLIADGDGRKVFTGQ
jgi:DNA (cytosine-5)-methyltransferase 1